MEAYTDFASVYDTFMDNIPYSEWAERIIGLLEKYGVKGQAAQPAEREASEERERVHGEALASEERERVHGEAPASGERERVHGEVLASGESEDVHREVLAAERNVVVDLGCGTGTLTELLADAGYDMIGIDNSQEMLRIAMEKKERSGKEILYLLQDMREFELYGVAGAIVSVCDSLNYLLEEEELEATFRLVNNYLYPGGVFIFDFNTAYKYETVIGDATIAENREDCSFIWENYYDAEGQLNEYDITVFVRETADGRFRRFTETHVQRGYTLGQMRGLVEKAGMEFVAAFDGDTCGEVHEESERIYVVARECGKGMG